VTDADAGDIGEQIFRRVLPAGRDDRTAALRSTVSGARGMLAPDQQKRPSEPGRLMSRSNL
jgi:hypothetical protein